jgi:hypothetical protein
MKDIMNALEEVHAEPFELICDSFEWKTEDYEWEVI